MPLTNRLHSVVAALAIPVLLACSFMPGGNPFIETAEARGFGPELDDAGPPTTARRTPSDGCEIVAHRGSCALESVSAVDAPSDGAREVVAVYRAVGDLDAPRIERRFRVSYLPRDEDDQMALLRANPSVACRWQTVLHGTCPAYPPAVTIPSIDEGDTDREGERAERHNRHQRSEERAERHQRHHRSDERAERHHHAEHGAHHHHRRSEDGEPPSHRGDHRSRHHGERQHHRHHRHSNG